MVSWNVGEGFRQHPNLSVLVTLAPLLSLVGVLGEAWHQVRSAKGIDVANHGLL